MPESRILRDLRRDLRRPFRKTGKALQREFMRQSQSIFDRQASPDGEPWAPLSPEYARRKRGPQILVETGRLRDSLINESADTIFNVRGKTIELGTSVEYAAPNHATRPFLANDSEKFAEVFIEELFRRR